MVERQIDDTGVWANVDGAQQLTPWKAYQRARLHDDCVVLLIGDYQASQIFPRSPLISSASKPR